MIDRKISVTTFEKSKNQAARQSEALNQNNKQGRWEVPTQSEANIAEKMFEQKNIKNIDTKVCPECD